MHRAEMLGRCRRQRRLLQNYRDRHRGHPDGPEDTAGDTRLEKLHHFLQELQAYRELLPQKSIDETTPRPGKIG